MDDDDGKDNYATFRDCFSKLVIAKLSPSAGKRQRRVKGRKYEIKPVARDIEKEVNDTLEELGEFIDYIATELFDSLPFDLRTLSYRATQDDVALKERYSVPIDRVTLESFVSNTSAAMIESLSTYGLLDTNDEADLIRTLQPIIESYIATTTATPPENSTLVQATECEMCERDQLPLTYHHLIPRAVHAKALKRGWVKEWEVQKVAWLCRACHSFVHRMASNEELAKDWNDMEVIMGREDVRAWAMWVRRVRWKKK